ncbi:Phage Tail Collar Domain protein [compost metagenome]
MCDGSLKDRTAYARLYAVIGHSYNAGYDPGDNQFRLPDLQGRTVIGVGTAQGAAGATNHPLAQAGGEETHTLTVSEMPAHSHGYFNAIAGGGKFTHNENGNVQPFAGTASGVTSSDGTGHAHNNMPPYLTLNYIIRT